MFDSSLEGQQQSTTLKEVDGVSVRSFEAFIQWLYSGIVEFDIKDPAEHLSAAIELTRFAERYKIVRWESRVLLKPQLGLQTLMCGCVEDIILADRRVDGSQLQQVEDNTCLNTEHIISGTSLSQGHQVRRVLAQAALKSYFLGGEVFKFRGEVEEVPSYGADVLHEVRQAMRSLRANGTKISYVDSITGERMSGAQIYG
jgi:hypothetical protein